MLLFFRLFVLYLLRPFAPLETCNNSESIALHRDSRQQSLQAKWSKPQKHTHVYYIKWKIIMNWCKIIVMSESLGLYCRYYNLSTCVCLVYAHKNVMEHRLICGQRCRRSRYGLSVCLHIHFVVSKLFFHRYITFVTRNLEIFRCNFLLQKTHTEESISMRNFSII